MFRLMKKGKNGESSGSNVSDNSTRSSLNLSESNSLSFSSSSSTSSNNANEDTRDMYYNIFQLFDTNHDGILDTSELSQIFKYLGKTETSTQDVLKLIRQGTEKDLKCAKSKQSNSDIQGITFDVFYDIMCQDTTGARKRSSSKILSMFTNNKKDKLIGGKYTSKELREVFDTFDEDGNGEISKVEFKTMVQKFNSFTNLNSQQFNNEVIGSSSIALGDSEIDYLFSLVDKENKESLNFEQFVNLFSMSLF
ncbi:hypothetical protein ABK040_009143 [Willaertia magna]